MLESTQITLYALVKNGRSRQLLCDCIPPAMRCRIIGLVKGRCVAKILAKAPRFAGYWLAGEDLGPPNAPAKRPEYAYSIDSITQGKRI